MLEIPYDREAENALIGLLIDEPDTFVEICDIVDRYSFWQQEHVEVFSAISDMYDCGYPINKVTVCSELRKRSKLDSCGGIEFLNKLIEGIPLDISPKTWAMEIKDYAAKRKAIQVADSVIREAQDPGQDLGSVLDSAADKLSEITPRRNTASGIKEVLAKSMRVLEYRSENPGVNGVTSGLKDLDGYTAGFQPSDLIILAARPSVGKTALALNISIAAAEAGKKVLFFSLEMGKEQLGLRMMAIKGRIDTMRFLSGKLDAEDFDRASDAINKLSSLGINVDDNPSASTQYIRSTIKRYMRDEGVDLVVIDYLQLMEGDKSLPREQQISEISRRLKGSAKEFNIPIIALSQLNRALENRSDKKPGLADLRESGAIEQDADVVIFLYRDEIHNKDSADKGIAEIILGKQRNGPTGTVRAAFVARFNKFGDLAPGYIPPPPKRAVKHKKHWQDK